MLTVTPPMSGYLHLFFSRQRHVSVIKMSFFLSLVLGYLQYLIVKPHWMCTNIRRLLLFSSLLLLSEETPRVPRTYQMAGRLANHWATPHPIELYLTEITINYHKLRPIH